MGLGVLGVLDVIYQMGLGVFEELGLGVLGVIDMIDQIYDSYDSSTHIYKSTPIQTLMTLPEAPGIK